MICLSGYACVVEVDGITRLYGPSKESDLDCQNLMGNSLLLFRTLAEAAHACFNFTRTFDSDGWNLYPIRVNIRIAESVGEVLLLGLQKTLMLIEVNDPNFGLKGCRFLGRRTPEGDNVADQLSSFETNGMKTFSSLGELEKAYREFQRQVGSTVFFSSFWYEKA